MNHHPHPRRPVPWNDRLFAILRRLLAVLAALCAIARTVTRC